MIGARLVLKILYWVVSFVISEVKQQQVWRSMQPLQARERYTVLSSEPSITDKGIDSSTAQQ